MTKISPSRINLEQGTLARGMLKNWSETLVGGSGGTNTGSSYTIDISTGNIFHLILNSATVSFTFSNPTAAGTACYFTLLLKQDATGGRQILWPSTVAWTDDIPPTPTTTASKYDIYMFMTINGGGTWHGSQSSVSL